MFAEDEVLEVGKGDSVYTCDPKDLKIGR